MEISIGKWGKSYALRIPKEIAERHHVSDGFTVCSEALEHLLEQERERRRDEALRAIGDGRIELPDDWKFDREDANWRPAMDRW